MCSRKRKGTEFRTLKYVDDEDRRSLRKIVRLTSNDSGVDSKKEDGMKENICKNGVEGARPRKNSAHAIALELVEQRKAVAEMLRVY